MRSYKSTLQLNKALLTKFREIKHTVMTSGIYDCRDAADFNVFESISFSR